MLGFLTSLFSGGIGPIVKAVSDVADEFIHSGEEKADFVARVEEMVTERMRLMEDSARATVEARMNVIVAELKHGDQYVSHTRPKIARWGLYVVMWNYAVVPTAGGLIQFAASTIDPTVGALVNVGTIELPTQFWVAWGGIVSTYSIGRSFEKFGVNTKATRMLSGSSSPDSIADDIIKKSLG